MDRLARCLVVSARVLMLMRLAAGDTFTVRIATESHVNQVDTKFVSFTLDPEYLFSSGDKSKGKESVCMAASLAPAFIRIAGPSTSHLTFHNTSMSLDELDTKLPEPNKQKRQLKASEETETEGSLDEHGLEGSIERHESILSKLKAKLKRSKDDREDSYDKWPEIQSFIKLNDHVDDTTLKAILNGFDDDEQELAQDSRNRRRRKVKDNLEVSHRQWTRFVKWANDTGFDLVFAVNNGEKTENGMWDPNPALSMLTVADQDGVDGIFWQLGYGCSNQTIEDYLNDLQTLRFMVDSFGERRWKVVGGDVSGCLQEGSKSDFKDYVTLSSEMMDAVLLNGNSSSRSLSVMSPSARLSLLRTLSSSSTPLWLTEAPQPLSELARAADWLTSLGYSARNGFDVHFRELLESELYEPTLSFYMALLFKNLVGERVLDLTTESSESSENNAALFAHCTSLRHKAVPGAVTLYGVNMDSEAARFSVKLTKREDGGDIMQFIVGHDHNGNIAVNGRPMFYEGDIRPVVKRVRPFKTLLLNLPPKTFGFWVLANTKVNACLDYKDEGDIKLVEAEPVDVTEVNEQNKTESIDDATEDKERVKRYVEFESDFDVTGLNYIDNDEALKNRIDSMNRGLRDIQGLVGNNQKSLGRRVKRQIFDEDSDGRMKLRKLNLRKFKQEHESLGSGIIEKIRNNIKNNIPKLNLTKNLKDLKERKPLRLTKNKLSKRHSRNYRNKIEDSEESVKDEFLSRRKRSVFTQTSKNEIDTDDKEFLKFGKFLGRQEKIKDVIEKHDEKDESHDEDHSNGEEVHDKIEINTKITDDDAVLKITENADHGLLKNTFENVLSLLEELNNNLSKLWTALSFLQ